MTSPFFELPFAFFLLERGLRTPHGSGDVAGGQQVDPAHPFGDELNRSGART
jgi:hypothetical protein